MLAEKADGLVKIEFNMFLERSGLQLMSDRITWQLETRLVGNIQIKVV